jgi:hypothetical protein
MIVTLVMEVEKFVIQLLVNSKKFRKNVNKDVKDLFFVMFGSSKS